MVMTCKVNLSALRYRVEIIDGHVPNVSHAHVATYIVLNHPFLTPFFYYFRKIIFDIFLLILAHFVCGHVQAAYLHASALDKYV